MKNHLLNLLKIGLSVGLLALLFTRIGIDEAMKAIREIDLAAFAAAFLDSLAAMDREGLGFQNRIDYDILTHQLKASIFSLDTIRSYQWNPRNYNVGGAIYSLLARDFAPLEERLHSVNNRLEAIPGVLEQARINLQNPPKIFTETAILQNKGTVSLIREELSSFIDQAPELREEIEPAQTRAIAALEKYGQWLENDLLPRSSGDFRLGGEKYRAKLSFLCHCHYIRVIRI